MTLENFWLLVAQVNVFFCAGLWHRGDDDDSVRFALALSCDSVKGVHDLAFMPGEIHNLTGWHPEQTQPGWESFPVHFYGECGSCSRAYRALFASGDVLMQYQICLPKPPHVFVSKHGQVELCWWLSDLPSFPFFLSTSCTHGTCAS